MTGNVNVLKYLWGMALSSWSLSCEKPSCCEKSSTLNSLTKIQVKGTSCWMKGIRWGLSKNGTLANGHDVMMKTAFGRGSKVAFGSLIARERCSKSVAKWNKVDYKRGCVVWSYPGKITLVFSHRNSLWLSRAGIYWKDMEVHRSIS